MNFQWPLGRWRNKLGISSVTRRAATLGGQNGQPEATTLAELRTFVSMLDNWPPDAQVWSENGSVIRVVFYSDADDMTVQGE